MVVAIVDTSAVFALLDADDAHHATAIEAWDSAAAVDLVAHAYVVTESLSLIRARLGWPAVVEFVDHVLPALRTEMVTHDVHHAALRTYRSVGGGTSFVDRVTIAFAQAHGIGRALAFDADLEAAGLEPLR